MNNSFYICPVKINQIKIYEETGETETFRFVHWNDFSEESVTLPLDKIVAGMLKQKY